MGHGDQNKTSTCQNIHPHRPADIECLSTLSFQDTHSGAQFNGFSISHLKENHRTQPPPVGSGAGWQGRAEFVWDIPTSTQTGSPDRRGQRYIPLHRYSLPQAWEPWLTSLHIGKTFLHTSRYITQSSEALHACTFTTYHNTANFRMGKHIFPPMCINTGARSANTDSNRNTSYHPTRNRNSLAGLTRKQHLLPVLTA